MNHDIIDNRKEKLDDVLAEGLNLQDCDNIINYDLHWNPVRLVQQSGTKVRIGGVIPLMKISELKTRDFILSFRLCVCGSTAGLVRPAFF